MEDILVSYRRFEDGDTRYDDLSARITNGYMSYRCPTYVNRTAPCSPACPSGHDVRTWLNVVARRIKPDQGVTWQEYAFRVMVKANPFPAVMGLTCTAPCQAKCNREKVEGHVGINSIEHAVGVWALEKGWKLPAAGADSGKTVAIVGGGPAGLSCAYQLRRLGHKVVLFDKRDHLGGSLRQEGCPDAVVDAEIARILDMGGIAVRLNTDAPADFSGHDAVFWSEAATDPGRPGHFHGGKTDLPTAAVGAGWRKAEAIDAFLAGRPLAERPRNDVHRFDMRAELARRGGAPEPCPSGPVHGTDTAPFAIHNYEDRSRDRVVGVEELFLGYFKETPRFERARGDDGALAPLPEAEAVKESRRCMSCGMCFECSLCIQYCPANAVARVKDGRAVGRFVDTEYDKCIGCQICRDVCPTGYIQMGLDR